MTGKLIELFLNMIAISLVSFGGGASALFYDFGVTRTAWITSGDLSAILAFGYATPGPAVFGIAGFIGYSVAGIVGLLVGTVSIFVMPWFLAMIATKHFGGLLKTKHATYFVKAVGLAAAGIVTYAAFKLMPPGSSSNVVYLGIALVVFGISTKWKINPLYILLAGGVASLFIN